MTRPKRSDSFFSLGPVTFTALFALVVIVIFASPVPAEFLPQTTSLTQAARHFGVTITWKPSEGKLSLSRDDHNAEILIGADRLIVDDYLMPLSSSVVVVDGTVLMSVEDSSEMFSRLLEREVTSAEILSAGLVFRQGSEVNDTSLVENVRYISYPRFTRIIVNLFGNRSAQNVDVNCAEGTRALTVVLANARLMRSMEAIEVGDRIVDTVEPVQESAGAKLIVATYVEKIKYKIHKHDDPPRVVIDIESAAPTIVTDFHKDANLHPQPNSWNEPEAIDRREQFPFTTIVIDPGHGGKDLGASGRGGLVEKNVTLDVAFKLKELIENNPGIKVILTRTGDYFVSLKDRTAIANQAKNGVPADLFISIHTNSHRSSKVGGFEAYYISDAIDPSAEATAAMENAVIELEQNGNGSIKSGLKPILWDLQFSEFISESSELAFISQRELGKRLNTRNRGVRQGQFIVLAGVAMPSILVEVGFISNRVEEAKLKTADFRNKCAEALASAVMIFKERYDMRLGLLRGKSNP